MPLPGRRRHGCHAINLSASYWSLTALILRRPAQEFDGANDATPAYVALRGEVFDVSSKPEHYKKGGSYHLFSGHDASYSLATGSLNPTDLDKRCAAFA